MKSLSPPESLPGARKVASLMVVVCWIMGGGCFLFSAFCFRAAWINSQAAGERTEFPLKLAAGETVRGQFNTTGHFPLEIWLLVQRSAALTDAQLDKFLRGTNAPFPIRWKVLQADSTIASGDSPALPPQSDSTGQSIGRLLGRFEPGLSGRYEWRASFGSPLPGIEGSAPVIEIRPSLRVLKNAGIRAAAGIWLGALSLLIGLVLVVLSWRERRKIRRELMQVRGPEPP